MHRFGSASIASAIPRSSDADPTPSLPPSCAPVNCPPAISSHSVDDNSPPMTVEEFSALLLRAGVPSTQRLAVGLSGGADSSALAILAYYESHRSHGHRPPPLILQVDHRLRPESTAETTHCSYWLSRLTPPTPIHIVLPLQWSHGRPAANRLQEVARERRREMLIRECGVRRVGWLLLAHHSGDQLETIVHRWTRGSGLYGLTGMAVTRTFSIDLPPQLARDDEYIAGEEAEEDGRGTGVVLCRPLLSVSKARLEATCRHYSVRWVEDVSNTNRAFERIRIREALAATLNQQRSSQPQPVNHTTAPLLLLTADVLAAVPAILSSCQQSVHDVTTSLLRRHATLVSPFSIAFLSSAAASLPSPILLTLFSRLLAVVRGSAHLPMGEPLHQLVRSLLQQQSSRTSPAAALKDNMALNRQQAFGCVVSSLRVDRRGKSSGGWMIARAVERVDEVTVPVSDSAKGQRVVWDDRFLVHLHFPPSVHHTPANCHHTVDYVLRPLRKADLQLFELSKHSSSVELRVALLTGLPLLVRRWKQEEGGGADGEDVVLVPHVPLLPLSGEMEWNEAERVRRARDHEIRATVTRLKKRVSQWDWTQTNSKITDDDISLYNIDSSSL